MEGRGKEPGREQGRLRHDRSRNDAPPFVRLDDGVGKRRPGSPRRSGQAGVHVHTHTHSQTVVGGRIYCPRSSVTGAHARLAQMWKTASVVTGHKAVSSIECRDRALDKVQVPCPPSRLCPTKVRADVSDTPRGLRRSTLPTGGKGLVVCFPECTPPRNPRCGHMLPGTNRKLYLLTPGSRARSCVTAGRDGSETHRPGPVGEKPL